MGIRDRFGINADFRFRHTQFTNFQFALPNPAARDILENMLAGASKRIGTAAKPSITTTTTSTTSTKSASGDGRNC
jgi:hypothetical protein